MPRPICGALETQLLFGEIFADDRVEGEWLHGVSQTDGYEGYICSNECNLTPRLPTHRVRVLRALIYEKPSCKSQCHTALPLQALVTVDGGEGLFAHTNGGWVIAENLAPTHVYENDYVHTGELFVGTPYLWGGRASTLGVDCSALTQLIFAATGTCIPRNSRV
jgi:hypothetical protein